MSVSQSAHKYPTTLLMLRGVAVLVGVCARTPPGAAGADRAPPVERPASAVSSSNPQTNGPERPMNVMRTVARYTHDRLHEWTMAATMILIGLQVAFWPSLLGDWSAAWPLMIVVGSLRLAALIANGRSYVYGPRIRAFGALAGALMWSQILVALIVVLPRPAAPSLEISVLLVMTVGELYSSYRAATDVRSPRKAS